MATRVSRPVLRSKRKNQARSMKTRRRLLQRDMARIILDEMHTFVALLDARGNLMEVNRTALAYVGISREEVVGCPLWQTPWGKDGSEDGARIRQACAEAASGQAVRVEFEAGDAAATGGHPSRSLCLSLTPVRDEKGQVILLIAETQDVTRARTAERERDLMAAQQRHLVREALFRITEGRLRLCDNESDFPTTGQPFGEPIVLTPNSLSRLRAQVAAAAQSQNLDAERIYDLITATGEAATNAVFHGGGGVGQVCVDAHGGVQVWIRDSGRGITLEELPRATLEPGYTTAGTLGQGFWIILHSADRLYMQTGADGTTIMLEQQKTPPLVLRRGSWSKFMA